MGYGNEHGRAWWLPVRVDRAQFAQETETDAKPLSRPWPLGLFPESPDDADDGNPDGSGKTRPSVSERGNSA